ncbi:MAG: hypothetical protein MK101_09030 [Phycisphaerales bacterium]|nr:hypothetical protein [Phycisphaerales bacterium]
MSDNPSGSETCTRCCSKACVLRVITWLSLLVTIAAWMVNALAASAALASTTFVIGIIAGALFLLFFAAQLMG